MIKPFKFFNAILILLYIVLMLGALLSTLVFVNVAFQGILDPVLNFIPEDILFCIVYAYGYYAVDFISGILPAIADFSHYIMLGLNALVFLWTFILFIRICRPSKHYRKFRGFTFFVNLLIAGIMGLNAYVLFTKGALSGDIYGMISFILSALFVFTFLYHFILNMRTIVLDRAVPSAENVVLCLFFAIASVIIGTAVFRKKQAQFVLYI